MVAICIIFLSVFSLVGSLGLTLCGPFQGFRLKLLVLSGVLFLIGVGARFFGERVLIILQLPTSYEALIYFIKVEMDLLWRSIQKRRSDIIISGILFGAAVLVVSFYVSAFISSGAHGPLIPGSNGVIVISETGFLHVPLAWVSMKFKMLFSFIPFISAYGLLFGILVVLLYAIFRLGMGQVASIICTLSFMVSSIQLDHLIPFWDKYYVRAPFVFSLVLIMGILATRSFKPKGTVGWAIIAGIVMGQALMFRPDVMVFAVTIALTLLFFLPYSTDVTMKVKVLAVLFFAVATIFSFSTCHRCSIGRAANGHAFINGSTPFFNDRLGLTRPKYDSNYLFLDEFTSSMSFAQARVFNDSISYTGYGPVNDQVKRIIVNFPADTLARFYGAALRVMEIPFTYVLHPVGVRNEIILSFYAGRAALLNLFAGLGIWFWAVALLMISARSLRKAIFCLMLIPPLVLIAFVHLVGYYFFYLEFITYWTIGFVAHHSVLAMLRLVKLKKDEELLKRFLSPNRWWNTSVKRMLAFVFGTMLIILLPLVLLRHYQTAQVSKLLHQYDTIATDPIKLETVPLQNNNVLLTNCQLFKPMDGKKFQIEELMALFSSAKCDSATTWITLRYKGTSDRRMDFSRSMSIDLSSSKEGRKRIFFPAIAQKDVYYPGYASYFSGIEIPEEQAACLEGLYRVRDLRQLSMLLTVQLPFDRNFSYARFADFEGNPNYTVPGKMPAETIARVLSQPLTPITSADVDYKDPIFSFVDDNKNKSFSCWKVNGYVKDNSHINSLFPINGPNWRLGKISYVNADALLVDTDLLITKPKWHSKGSAFVARGKLYSGGVAFVLLNENHPSGLVIVANPGKFNVIIEVPRDGFYSVGLMNYVAYYNTMENRMIAKAGWAER